MDNDSKETDDFDPADHPAEEDDAPDELTGDLVAYLDGELDRQGTEAVSARISLDATVRAEATAFKKTWDLLDHLPRPEPSASFTERTLSRIEPLRQSSGGVSMPAGRTSTSAPVIAGPARRSASARLRYAAGWLILLGLTGVAGYFIRGLIVDQLELMALREKDGQILAEQRLLQNLPAYRHIDDLSFLKSLDDPDLFGDEHPLAPIEEGSK